MLRPGICLAIFLMVSVAIVRPAQAFDLCGDAVRIAEQYPGGLSIYQDNQIRNGLCLTTKMAAEAIASGDETAQENCLQAAVYFAKEFKTRFPGEDPSSVAGKC